MRDTARRERNETICQLARAGFTSGEIARQFGMRRKWVWELARTELNAYRVRRNAELRAAALTGLYTADELAHKFRLTRDGVRFVLTRAERAALRRSRNVRPPLPRLVNRRRRVARLRRAGWIQTRIAAELGVSRQTIIADCATNEAAA